MKEVMQAVPVLREKEAYMNNQMHYVPEEFKVSFYQQGRQGELTDKDLRGHWSVMFFYPADFTFVCPTELEDMADHYSDFKAEGCEVYSVSEDSFYVHKAWADASEKIAKIQFPMLGDPAGVLARQFGVLEENAGQAYRGTFILNPRAEVVVYEVNDMGIGRNADELLRLLRAARFVEEHGDQVCPAKWKPGADTLKPSLDLVGML